MILVLKLVWERLYRVALTDLFWFEFRNSFLDFFPFFFFFLALKLSCRRDYVTFVWISSRFDSTFFLFSFFRLKLFWKRLCPAVLTDSGLSFEIRFFIIFP